VSTGLDGDGDGAEAAEGRGVIVLIGPPASGKSSVGALLAAGLSLPLVDTDDLVVKAAGKPVGDIFIEDGESTFREHERAAVARGLDGLGTGGGILALGSGAVLDPDVRRMVEKGKKTVVYLAANFGTVAKRTGFDKPRVVIPGNPRGRLRTMLDERRPVYESLAALTVSTDDLLPEEVAADLLKRLEAEGF
jgi:shikimate kinase